MLTKKFCEEPEKLYEFQGSNSTEKCQNTPNYVSLLLYYSFDFIVNVYKMHILLDILGFPNPGSNL